MINNKKRYQALIHTTFAYKLRTGKRVPRMSNWLVKETRRQGIVPMPKAVQEMIIKSLERHLEIFKKVEVSRVGRSAGLVERGKYAE